MKLLRNALGTLLLIAAWGSNQNAVKADDSGGLQCQLSCSGVSTVLTCALEDPYPTWLETCHPDNYIGGSYYCPTYVDSVCSSESAPWASFPNYMFFWWQSMSEGTVGGTFECAWTDEVNGCPY